MKLKEFKNCLAKCGENYQFIHIHLYTIISVRSNFKIFLILIKLSIIIIINVKITKNKLVILSNGIIKCNKNTE